MSPLYFVSILLSFQIVFGLKKEYCAFKDEVCLTEGVQQHVFSMFVAGLPGVQPTDPLHLDTTTVSLPDSTYKIHDGILHGIKNCLVQKLKLDQKDSIDIFTKEIFCPVLTLKTSNEVTSHTNTVPVEKFNCETTYHNYNISFHGKYNKIINSIGKTNVQILSYTHDAILQGEVTYECKSLDLSKNDNHNYSHLEDVARPTVMNKFLNMYMEHLTAFLAAVPIEELHFRFIPE